jgi:hypothetical protein
MFSMIDFNQLHETGTFEDFMQLYLLKYIEYKSFDEESRIIKEVFKGKNGLLKLIEVQT